jgi:hypothetical protein
MLIYSVEGAVTNQSPIGHTLFRGSLDECQQWAQSHINSWGLDDGYGLPFTMLVTERELLQESTSPGTQINRFDHAPLLRIVDEYQRGTVSPEVEA